jgi:hypothetical protein
MDRNVSLRTTACLNSVLNIDFLQVVGETLKTIFGALIFGERDLKPTRHHQVLNKQKLHYLEIMHTDGAKIYSIAVQREGVIFGIQQGLCTIFLW